MPIRDGVAAVPDFVGAATLRALRPVGGWLSAEQCAQNEWISAIRVPIEQAAEHLEAWHIPQTDYRCRCMRTTTHSTQPVGCTGSP